MSKITVAMDMLNHLSDVTDGKITTDKIKQLRGVIGGGINISDCKNILFETEGNMYKAVQRLAEKGVLTLYKRKAKLNIFDTIKLREPYMLSELITIIANEANEFENSFRHSYADTSFDIYTRNFEDFVSSKVICYVDCPLIVTDKNEEIYPDFVIKEGLEFCCSGELFEDVIYNAVYQKNQPSMDEFVTALNFYITHDSYLDL